MTSAEITEWNNSALTTLQQCGEKFRRKYVQKDYIPPTPRLVRGRVVHRIASRAYLRKMTEQALPSLEETQDTAATEFDQDWASGVVLSEDEASNARATRDEAKDFTVDLSGFHVEKVAPAIQPVGVERKIIVRPKDSDLMIHGTIDLIDKTPSGEVIRDLKTSEKSPSADTANRSQQLTVYAMIRQAEVGKLPDKLTLDYLVRTPARKEKKHVPLTTTRDGEDVRALVNRINTAVEAVKRGNFVPANPDSWYCAKAYCEYWTTCPYVRQR